MTTTLDAAIDAALDHIDDTAADEPVKRPAPYIAALRADQLFADPAYQRDLDELRVQRMVDDFDPTLLGVLEVSDRTDGTFALLDGQHRWAAAREAHPDRDQAALVCQVHRGLTVEDEARVFYEIDARRKALSGWDRWKARRGSGDRVVLDVERIVAAEGLKVDPASKDGCVSATVALERVFTIGGEPLLASTLTILKHGFGAVRDAFDGQLVQAVAFILITYGIDELDHTRLVEQMQTIPPRQVKAKAQALKEAHRAEMPRLCAAVIIDRYNAGKGRTVDDFLSIAPAQSKAMSKGGRRSRQLDAIRRWANRNGHYCSPTGRIAQSVIDAYRREHPDFVAAAS